MATTKKIENHMFPTRPITLDGLVDQIVNKGYYFCGSLDPYGVDTIIQRLADIKDATINDLVEKLKQRGGQEEDIDKIVSEIEFEAERHRRFESSLRSPE